MQAITGSSILKQKRTELPGASNLVVHVNEWQESIFLRTGSGNRGRTKSSAAPGLRWKRPSFKRKLMMRHFLKLCFEHIQLFNNGWLRKKF